MGACLACVAGCITRRSSNAASRGNAWQCVRVSVSRSQQEAELKDIFAAIVFIVYGVLLRDIDLGKLLPWVIVVIYYVFPIVVLADWLYQPPKSIFRLAQIGYWLIYTLIRGAITGFYPYPFLDPSEAGGYVGVALSCLAIFATFLVVGAGLIALGNWSRGAIGRAAF